MSDELYRYAEERWPDILEQLRSLDKDLAALHQAGMEIQRRRLSLLNEIAKHAGLTRAQKIMMPLDGTLNA